MSDPTEQGDPKEAAGALVPTREQTVDFYGDAILVADVDGTPYVPLRPISENLGLSWPAQTRRVERDEVLASTTATVAVTATDGRTRLMLCLPLEILPGWLFGVDTSRVRPELREKITRYRRECFRVLWRAFIAPPAPLPPSDLDQTLDAFLAEIRALRKRADITNADLAALEERVELLAAKVRGFHTEHRLRFEEVERAIRQIRALLQAG